VLADPAALRDEIRVTRQRGYSVDDGESSPSVRCLAVAIRGVDDRPLFAISLTGPAGRFTTERMEACVPEMLAVARMLTAQFGGEA
jgi:IclR family acetate operon transcriptional repressor